MYLPKYVLSTDDELERSDKEIQRDFMESVRRMLPEFNMEPIDSNHIYRAFKVQPLQILGYSELVPARTSGISVTSCQNVVISPQCRIGDHVKFRNIVSVYTGVIIEDDMFYGRNFKRENGQVMEAS